MTPKCFVAGTAVVTSVGLVAIEHIKPGDMVLAENEETGEIAYKEVVRTFTNTTEELTHVTITTQDGQVETIDATPQHPFYVEGKGWVEASALHVGMVVWLADGTKAVVTDVVTEGLEEPVTVYNFEVADFHTYFVGDSGVLVHNTCPQNSTGTSQQNNAGTSQVQQNYQQGKQFQALKEQDIKARSTVDADTYAHEVTLRPLDANGNPMMEGSIRVDGIAFENGTPKIYEMKSSQSAPFTRNQTKAGYADNGATLSRDYIVVGTAGGETWTGQKIPKGTSIEVLRP